MHGAPVRDLHQAFPLLVIQRAEQRDSTLHLVYPRVLVVAVRSVLDVYLLVLQADEDSLERPFLSARVHAKRDAGAGPQTGQDQIVGCGAGVVPSESLRFICDERVALSPDLTRITRAGLDDDAMGVVVPFVGVDGFQLDVLACPGGKDRPDVTPNPPGGTPSGPRRPKK